MVIYRTESIIRPATISDHRELAKYLTHETQVHRHLDWRGPLEWLGAQPFLIAEHEDAIQGVLACPPDPAHVAWVRLFAASRGQSVSRTWGTLLDAAIAELDPQVTHWIAAIALTEWFERTLQGSGLTNQQDIVILEWNGPIPAEHPLPTNVAIRPMTREDLPEVQAIDAAAFGPLWQNSLESIQLAYDQAAWSTVAVTEQGLVGYQISTAIPLSGHLARLAVLPSIQHQQIGYNLVRELIIHFKHKGAWRVTVNTQNDNYASLALYEKAGFRRTGEVFPVYMLSL